LGPAGPAEPVIAVVAGPGGGMSRGVSLWPGVTDDTRLARARERFLTAEPIEPGQVRDTILASWRRSREWHVAADRIDLSYVRDPGLDTPLTRTALPVLQNLRDNLEGEPISVILTDAHGVALSRLTADRDLERYLDSVQLAPGFGYAEEFVGTDAIGTALESGRAVHVFGHEHHAGPLENLACAAVPIRHPISGKDIGAVNLTGWRKDAGRLLIALAQSTAGQITQALLNDSSAGEFQLLQEYLRACRHTGGFVFALTSDMVLMNDHARDALAPGDQAALLGHAAEALAGGHPGPMDVELPTGARARMHCRPLRAKGSRRLVAGVVHVKPASRPAGQQPMPGQARRRRGWGPAWSAPVRCGCAAAVRSMRPAPQASGSRSGASPEPASWRCCGPSTGAAAHPARFMCWTPPKPVITTGWCGRSANYSRARGAWSSGTSTGSAPCGCRRCG
jgi:GAF domain-containing protein